MLVLLLGLSSGSSWLEGLVSLSLLWSHSVTFVMSPGLPFPGLLGLEV